MKLLSMTSVFSLETEGRKASIKLSEQANVHTEALRWFVKNFNTDESFWKSNSGKDWFSFYGKIDPSLISLVDNPQYRLGWLLPSFIGGMKMPKTQHSQNGRSVRGPRQLIIYGAPGTGKSWRIKEDTKGCEVIRTTFHPDSDYSTFVGAYKPSMEADKYDTVVTTGEKNAAGAISKKDGLVRQKRIVYKFVAQAFLEAYVVAWRKCAAFLAAQTDEAKTAAEQFLVIEEINRGNCAQIFGDIFQLLDREDDGYSSYAIKSDTDLCQFLSEAFGEHADKGIAALDLAGVNLGDRDVTPDEIKTGKQMLLPPNMFIWATMNTSDQSLFPIDSAFKRRWDWEYVPIAKPDKSGDSDWKERKIEVGDSLFDWWDFLSAINGHIAKATESEDKQLGYFFVKADDATGYISAEQFANKVLFYLYGDVFKSYELPKKDCFQQADNTVLKFRDFFYSEKVEEGEGENRVTHKPGDVKLDVVAAFLRGLKWKEKGVKEEPKGGAADANPD